MKTLLPNRIVLYLQPIYWLIIIFVSVLWLGSGTASAQIYAPQDGRALDANPRVGSFGLNARTRIDALVPRANLGITGNISGGARFQGLIPYQNLNEFSAPLGSGTLSNFRRDSVNVRNSSRGSIPFQPYLDYSKSITRSRGRNVVSTQQMYLGMSPSSVGASSYQRRVYNNPLAVQPLMNYSAGKYPLGRNTFQSLDRFSVRRPSEIPFAVRKLPSPKITDKNNFDQLQQSLRPETPAEKTEEQPDKKKEGVAERENRFSLTKFMEPVDNYLEMQKSLSRSSFDPDKSSPAQSLQPPANQESEEITPSRFTVSRDFLSSAPLTTSAGSITEFSQKQFHRYMKRGEELLRQGKFYRAAESFDSAALYVTDNGLVYVAKSHALLAAGEFMSSAYYLNKAINLTPNLARARIKLSELFPDPKKFQKRLKEIEEARESSGNAMLEFLQGYVYYQQGQLDNARQALSQASQSAPQAKSVTLMLDAVNKALENQKKKEN